MDTYDNNELYPESEQTAAPQQESVPEAQLPPQSQYTSQPEANAYRGAGTGRKESPYANSPYVMNHPPRQETSYSYVPPRQEYSYQPQQEPPRKPKKKASGSFWKRAVAAVLTVALVAGGCAITAYSVNSYWEERNRQTVAQMNAKMEELQKQIDSISIHSGSSVSGSPAAVDGLTPGQVYAQNVDSVVAISSTIQTTSYYGTQEGASSGSGFILTENGYVVTNYHVVEGASSVDVITEDGTEYPAQVVGYDSANDLAVLKVEAEGLPAATLGSSDDLIIGDMVVAIGNPLGELTSTQTVGYVSGKDRDVTTDGTIISMIQTDAAINPGNSGGPLFNMKGEVIGITTAKYSGTTGSGASIEGIGFAIPIDDVIGIISDLMDYGYVTGAYLGVTVEETDQAAASMFGLPTGAYVRSVEEGAAAHRAGIQPKDIIIDLGGYEVSGITSLTRALRNFKAGDTTTVTVIRSGATRVMDITLDEKPQNFSSTVTPEQDSTEGTYPDGFEWFFGDRSGG